jgi:hypothetical protein
MLVEVQYCQKYMVELVIGGANLSEAWIKIQVMLTGEELRDAMLGMPASAGSADSTSNVPFKQRILGMGSNSAYM